MLSFIRTAEGYVGFRRTGNEVSFRRPGYFEKDCSEVSFIEPGSGEGHQWGKFRPFLVELEPNFGGGSGSESDQP